MEGSSAAVPLAGDTTRGSELGCGSLKLQIDAAEYCCYGIPVRSQKQCLSARCQTHPAPEPMRLLDAARLTLECQGVTV